MGGIRPVLEGAFEQEERKSPAGRKRIDVIIMFKMLVLQHLFNLSDAELEFQVNDRRSFEEFVGLGAMDSIGAYVAQCRNPANSSWTLGFSNMNQALRLPFSETTYASRSSKRPPRL